MLDSGAQMHLACLVPHQKGWTWSQMTENWTGYLLRPSWALSVHRNFCFEDACGNFGPLLTWPPPMPCTVQPCSGQIKSFLIRHSINSKLIWYVIKVNSKSFTIDLKDSRSICRIQSWFEVDSKSIRSQFKVDLKLIRSRFDIDLTQFDIDLLSIWHWWFAMDSTSIQFAINLI